MKIAMKDLVLYKIEWYLDIEDRTLSKTYKCSEEEAVKKYTELRDILSIDDEICLFRKECSFLEDGELKIVSEPIRLSCGKQERAKYNVL